MQDMVFHIYLLFYMACPFLEHMFNYSQYPSRCHVDLSWKTHFEEKKDHKTLPAECCIYSPQFCSRFSTSFSYNTTAQGTRQFQLRFKPRLPPHYCAERTNNSPHRSQIINPAGRLYGTTENLSPRPMIGEFC